MVTQHRKFTAAEREFAARIFVDRYTHCLKEINERGLEGCAQLARHETEAALVEFRKLLSGQQQ